MKISDTPIFGGLLEATLSYFSITQKIMKHPIRFGSELEEVSGGELLKAMKFFFSSLIVGYILIVPALVKYQVNYSQGLYAIVFASIYLILFLFLFLSAFVFRVNYSLRIAYMQGFYLIGFWGPMVQLFTLPYALFVDPKELLGGEIIFSGVDTLIGEFYEGSSGYKISLVFGSLIIAGLLSMWALWLQVVWFAQYAIVTKKKTIIIIVFSFVLVIPMLVLALTYIDDIYKTLEVLTKYI